jgi:hypothetical protein
MRLRPVIFGVETMNILRRANVRVRASARLTGSPSPSTFAMQKLITTATLLLSLFAVSAMADELTGWISDSKCGAKGASAEHKDCAAK